MSRRRTSATVLCRSNCGPDCGPPAGRDAEPTGPFVARIAGPAQSPGLSLRRAACEAGSPSVNSVVPKDGHLAGQHTSWASNSVAILSGRCTRNVHSATKSSNALSASYGRPPPCTANSISVSAERCESEDLIERVRPALGASAPGKYAAPRSRPTRGSGAQKCIDRPSSLRRSAGPRRDCARVARRRQPRGRHPDLKP
jgi:hypothetical protein